MRRGLKDADMLILIGVTFNNLHRENSMSTSLLYHAFGVRGYARMVKQRCGTLIVQCQPGLVPLLSRMPGVDRVIAGGESLPVGGGRTLDHFAGRGGIWPAVVGGGRPPEKWRADGVAIRLE